MGAIKGLIGAYRGMFGTRAVYCLHVVVFSYTLAKTLLTAVARSGCRGTNCLTEQAVALQFVAEQVAIKTF